MDVVDPTPLRGANEVEATPERGRAGSASAAGTSVVLARRGLGYCISIVK